MHQLVTQRRPLCVQQSSQAAPARPASSLMQNNTLKFHHNFTLFLRLFLCQQWTDVSPEINMWLSSPFPPPPLLLLLSFHGYFPQPSFITVAPRWSSTSSDFCKATQVCVSLKVKILLMGKTWRKTNVTVSFFFFFFVVYFLFHDDDDDDVYYIDYLIKYWAEIQTCCFPFST